MANLNDLDLITKYIAKCIEERNLKNKKNFSKKAYHAWSTAFIEQGKLMDGIVLKIGAADIHSLLHQAFDVVYPSGTITRKAAAQFAKISKNILYALYLRDEDSSINKTKIWCIALSFTIVLIPILPFLYRKILDFYKKRGSIQWLEIKDGMMFKHASFDLMDEDDAHFEESMARDEIELHGLAHQKAGSIFEAKGVEKYFDHFSRNKTHMPEGIFCKINANEKNKIIKRDLFNERGELRKIRTTCMGANNVWKYSFIGSAKQMDKLKNKLIEEPHPKKNIK